MNGFGGQHFAHVVKDLMVDVLRRSGQPMRLDELQDSVIGMLALDLGPTREEVIALISLLIHDLGLFKMDSLGRVELGE